MSEDGLISNTRELIAGVNREKKWILTIGIMGILFALIFAVTMIAWRVLRPAGIIGLPELRTTFLISEILFTICSIISVIAGVRVLMFFRTWQERYSKLKAAEQELEKRYFQNPKQ
jgi:membrane protein implicated in regulation of membrane protease activity